MSITSKNFYTKIYQEHCSEMGALLSSFQAYMNDPDISWLSMNEFVFRIDAHLDAVMLGGNMAWSACADYLSGTDDELVGAVFMSASLSGRETELIEAFTQADDESIALIILGMRYGLISTFNDKYVALLSHDKTIIRLAVAQILGYRGDADPHRIWPLFHDKDESVKTAAMIAVMRLGFKEAVPSMEQAVLENKDMFNEHRVFPLLMLGSKKALQFTRDACQSASDIKPQYPIYLALAGHGEDIVHLFHVFKFDDIRLAALEALGILGSLHGINTLMNFLSSKNDEEKLAAAKSLNQISGAQLYETLTIIEKEEDDIDPEDITGLSAASGEGKQPGDERQVEIKQACTDKDRWGQWWQENKAHFDQSLRYRHGKPYSFLLCLQEIAHPETNYKDRQRAYHELVIRSGHHIPFEPDWFVDKQIEALKKWQTWWNENKTRLMNQWMFDGM